MRSRILSLWLPHLATDRLRRDRPELGPSEALATFESSQGTYRLVAVDAAAMGVGLGPGVTLADARALMPGLVAHPAEPEADRRLLERLVRWCERYTPQVAIDRSCHHAAGGGLWLDITGGAHLFGGEVELRADLLARLRRMGLSARAAIADRPGTAWALARYGDHGHAIAAPGNARVALAPLPVAALRLVPEQVQMLERLGLSHVDSLYPLPRQALAARFGDALVRRLDQALGAVAEPISPAPPQRAHRAALVLAEPIGHAEGLEALVRRLLGELCAGLETTCLGARRLTLALYRVDNTIRTIGIGTSRPARDARQLMRLFREKLVEVDLGFGIERAILDAEVVEPLLPEPLAWRQMGAGDLDQVRDLAPLVAPLVDRLAGRLGEAAVVQLVPRASHIPERAQRPVPALSGPAPGRRGGGAALAVAPALPLPRVAPRLCIDTPTRPLRLLVRPEPVEAVAPLPDEPPVLFRWRRVVHKVAHVRGPERLAPEWWLEPESDPDAMTRDYFAVEDEAGSRFWLFREGLWRAGAALTPRWYLHGLFT
jgi:protein ImuB